METGIAPQSVLNGNSLYYRLYLSNEDWHTASKKASAAGGYLLSVDNQQEQDFISQNIGVFFSEVVTGLSDLNVDGIYIKPDGSALTYSNFLPGYPFPWGVDQPTAYAILITRTHFNSWEGNWRTNQWYSQQVGNMNTSTIDARSGEIATGV